MTSCEVHNGRPLVSVVIPVYNTERFVAETLRSVLGQTYPEIEVIVVIDGSTDASLEICKGFSDPRLRIIVQENRGLAGARNRGLREAGGRYIGFIDSDDSWHPEKVERHVAQFEREPALGVGFSYSALMDNRSRSLGTFQMEGRARAVFSDFFVRNVMGNGSNAILRREVFAGRESASGRFPALEGFREELKRAEDYELWCRIAYLTDWEMSCLPEALVNYRINPAGLSANVHLQRKYHFLAMARVASFAPDAAESLRCRAVAHTYWHQARTAASQKAPRVGTNAVKLALWFDWRSITANHLMICLAVAASLVLPQKAYFGLQRRAGRLWGRFQRLQMKRRDRARGQPVAKPDQQASPARVLVKKPAAYARRKALPNLFYLCHAHRFMYLGIAKNASTTLKFLVWNEEHPGQKLAFPGASHEAWGFAPVEGRTIERRDHGQMARYENYLRFTVYRDPVSRFLSAYHNRVLFAEYAHPYYTGKRLSGMGLDQFIRVAEQALKVKNPLHIDEHLRPQAWCFEPSDVNYIVPIRHLQAFLLETFGLRQASKANRTDLPTIEPRADQVDRIRRLYACDYDIEPNWAPSPDTA